jgi:hypothetical protein
MHKKAGHKLIFGFSFLTVMVFVTIRSKAQFSEITSQQGISNINTGTIDGNGVTFCDIDKNGFDDISFGRTTGSPLIYLNSNGVLSEFTPELPTLSGQQIKAQLWADYDNDGDRDLLLSYWADPVKLLRNEGDMVFSDVTSAAGLLSEDVNHFGAAWSDVDRDGFLDLFLCKYSNPGNNFGYQYTNRFYHNNGDGTFSDQTVASGLGGLIKSSFQAVFLDYNNDSWPDLYIINDKVQQENNLFRNDGDGTFTNVSFTSGAAVMIDAMTATVDDYNHDGFLDIYVSNNPTGNVLLHNNGNGTFTDYAQQTGTELNITSWGCLWIDYDNNSWQDLFIGTTSGLTNPMQNYLLINNNGDNFTVGNSIAGIDGDADPSFSVAQGDLNQDGYFDYVTNNNDPYTSSLWLNDGGENAFLAVTLEGTVSNRDAVGSWIECYVDGTKYIRYTTCGENYIGQNSFTEIFGLGTTSLIDSLVIKWPGGLTERYEEVAVNQHLQLIEGASLINGPAPIVFDGDLYLCPGDSLVCTLPEGSSYSWSSGATGQSVVIYEPGIYLGTVFSSYGLPQNSEPFEILWAPETTWTQETVNPLCYGSEDGSAEVILDPEPASFLWSNGAESPSLNGLGPDTLWWDATNQYGCGFSDTIFISQPDSLILELTIVDAACYGESSGSVSASISGGIAGYDVIWSDNLDPAQVPAGDYSILVYDSNGCESSQNFTVNEPAELVLTVTTFDIPLNEFYGSAEATASGGTPPYSVIWSSGAADIWTVDDLFADDYFVIVTDSAGCTDTVQFSIFTRIEEFTISSKSFFFPNPATEYIEVTGANGAGEILIYKADGSIAMSRSVFFQNRSNTQRIPVWQLNTGLYQVRLIQENRISSGILVKE